MQMWELIEQNKRKSLILFFSMGFCLLILGYVIGSAYHPSGGIAGVFIALMVWTVMSLVSYFSGDSIILSMSRAKEVTHDLHPRLFNIVEEMKIAANLAIMPKIYIIGDSAPNAFAVGRKPEKSAIVVTAGLLSKLNRDELQGVIAHEMSHIINRDVLFVTFAGILLGSIVLISHVFLRGLWYSGSSRRYRSSSSSGGGQAQMIMMLVSVAFAILAPIFARLLYFAISRKREYLADASAARLTRYPEGLAAALEKIALNTTPLEAANKVTAPMYIINPLEKKKMMFSSSFSTHPPAQERIRILRRMNHGVNFLNYQKAFNTVKGSTTTMFPKSALEDKKSVDIRKPTIEQSTPQTAKDKMRDVGDLIRMVNGYAFLACVCGLKIKLPANYKKSEVSCPRCSRKLQVPLAEVAAVATMVGSATSATKETGTASSNNYYKRRGKGWETFSCSCGVHLTISPLFCGKFVPCSKCGRKTEIRL